MNNREPACWKNACASSRGRYGEAADMMTTLLNLQVTQQIRDMASVAVRLLRSAPANVDGVERLPRLASAAIPGLRRRMIGARNLRGGPRPLLSLMRISV